MGVIHKALFRSTIILIIFLIVIRFEGLNRYFRYALCYLPQEFTRKVAFNFLFLRNSKTTSTFAISRAFKRLYHHYSFLSPNNTQSNLNSKMTRVFFVGGNWKCVSKNADVIVNYFRTEVFHQLNPWLKHLMKLIFLQKIKLV